MSPLKLCGGLDSVVLTVLASGLLMSEDGLQHFGLCRHSVLWISETSRLVEKMSISQSKFQAEKRLETVEMRFHIWEMAQVSRERACLYLRLIESQIYILQVQRIAC